MCKCNGRFDFPLFRMRDYLSLILCSREARTSTNNLGARLRGTRWGLQAREQGDGHLVAHQDAEELRRRIYRWLDHAIHADPPPDAPRPDVPGPETTPPKGAGSDVVPTDPTAAVSPAPSTRNRRPAASPTPPHRVTPKPGVLRRSLSSYRASANSDSARASPPRLDASPFASRPRGRLAPNEKPDFSERPAGAAFRRAPSPEANATSSGGLFAVNESKVRVAAARDHTPRAYDRCVFLRRTRWPILASI